MLADSAGGPFSLFTLFGRLHPLVLHVPIGAVLALAVVELLTWFAGFEESRRPHGMLAWLAAVSAWISVSTGLVMHANGTYDPDDALPHRNLAIACSIMITLAAFANCRSNYGKRAGMLWIYRILLFAGIAAMIPAGHLGATMTHGEGYLMGFSPGAASKPESNSSASVESAPADAADGAFSTIILPILRAKCLTCHGEDQRKGKLSLESVESIRAGGKSGPAIDREKPADSLILERIHRDLEEKGHMPPRSKTQLLESEIASIDAWVKTGAAPNAGSLQLNGGADSKPAAPDTTESHPARARVDDGAFRALRDALVHVQPVKQGSELLWMDFAAPAARLGENEILQLLKPVAGDVGDLALNRSKITDEGMASIAAFPRLRRLELRSTAVGDAGIDKLKNHPSLEELILTQTKTTDASVDSILTIPKLAKVYVWGSGLTPEGLARLRAGKSGLQVDAGDAPAAAVVKVEDPIKLSGDAPLPGAQTANAAPANLKPINSVCPVTGKPLNPAYQIVFEGKVIGFCCPNCPSKFWENPAEFKAKIPQ